MVLLYLFEHYTLYIDIEYVNWSNPDERLHMELAPQFIDNLLVQMHTDTTIIKVEISIQYISLTDERIILYCSIRPFKTFALILDFDLELCFEIIEFFINFLNHFSKDFDRFTIRLRTFYCALKKIHEHILEELLIKFHLLIFDRSKLQRYFNLFLINFEGQSRNWLQYCCFWVWWSWQDLQSLSL